MKEQLSGGAFRAMSAAMRIMETVYPYAKKRARSFGIAPGITLVDYACGPGRYTLEFARLVGARGKVIAVDIQPLGLEAVRRKAQRQGVHNIETKLAIGYDSGLEPTIADRVFALDVFFMIENPTAFLAELHRICKPGGTLVIDDGHQSRATTLRKMEKSAIWRIVQETKGHLVCEKSY